MYTVNNSIVYGIIDILINSTLTAAQKRTGSCLVFLSFHKSFL